MEKRRIWFFSALIVTISAIALLVTGSPLLTLGVDAADTIPLGTFITWAGLIALPLSIYWGIQALRSPTTTLTKILSTSLKIILVLAILWVPISYLLAGSLAFTFSEKETFQGGQAAMRWFWRLNYGIPAGSILILVVYWISLLFGRVRAVSSKG